MKPDSRETKPAAAEAEAAIARRAARFVILYDASRGVPVALRQALAGDGMEVLDARSFHDVTAWLVLHRGAAVIVHSPPKVDSLRRSVLQQLRRTGPAVPIVAVVDAITEAVRQDLELAQVTGILASSATPTEAVAAVRAAFTSRRAMPSRDAPRVEPDDNP